MIPLTWYMSFEMGRGALGLIDGDCSGHAGTVSLLGLRYVYLHSPRQTQ